MNSLPVASPVDPEGVLSPARWAEPTQDAWCILDAQHHVLMWNDALSDLLGRAPVPFDGGKLHPNMAGWTPADQARLVEALLQSPGAAVEWELELLASSGERLPLRAQVCALRGATEDRLMMRLRPVGPVQDPDARVGTAARRWKLTQKQRDVLLHVALGLSNKAAARRLGCAESTVELHLTAVFKRSGTKGRSMLLARLFSLA